MTNNNFGECTEILKPDRKHAGEASLVDSEVSPSTHRMQRLFEEGTPARVFVENHELVLAPLEHFSSLFELP